MEKLFITVPIDMYLIIFLSAALIIAATIDVRTYSIPNLLTYPTILIALIYHTVTNGINGIIFSTLGLIVGMGLFSIPFFMGIMGAGDAKLMGAVGAVLGCRGVLNASVFTAVAGGVFALILLLSYYKDFRFVTRAVESIQASLTAKCLIRVPLSEKERKPKLYYGIAIALGTLYTMWWKVSHAGFPL